jgi:hypothetical protein
MKVFIWLLTGASVLVCSTAWVMSELVERSLIDTMSALPVPYFTRFVIHPHFWLLLVPLPWGISAGALTCRREISPAAVSLFAGTLVLITTLLACAVTIALVLPYIPRHA